MINGQIYLIGSLKNRSIIDLTTKLTDEGFDIFSDWLCPGPDADDFLRDYYKARGYSYKQALASPAAQNIFQFDKKHIDESAAAVLVMPAGKSAHLELGYVAGQGKPAIYYMEEEPERYDIMVNFCSHICIGYDDLLDTLKNGY
jgi:hypothetical protein